MTQVAADNGAGVNDEQARAYLQTQAVQTVGEERAGDLTFGPGSLAVARSIVSLVALQETPEALAEVSELVAEADVDVNPRFGELTPELFVAPPTTPSWFVQEPQALEDGATGEVP